MTSAQSSPNEIIRRALLKIESATVLKAVDSLDLRGTSKVSAVVGVPLRKLQQRRNVEIFATTAPLPAVRALLEVLSARPLDQVIHDLAEHASEPSYEQLSNAVKKLLHDGATTDEAVALLTFVIGEGFPAAPHCRRLLAERAEFDLPLLAADTVVSTLLVPKEIDPEVREQRRVRREEGKRKKMQKAATAQARPQNKPGRPKSSVSSLPPRGFEVPTPPKPTPSTDPPMRTEGPTHGGERTPDAT